MRIPRSRFIAGFAVAAYIAAFQWMYVTWLSPTFDYWGFGYNPPPLVSLGVSWTLALLPALWLPVAITRPSQLITWVLYLTVLIPSMFVPLFVALREPQEVNILMLALFLGFSIVSFSSRSMPLWSLRRLRAPVPLYWSMFGVFLGGLIVWVVIVYMGHFRLVTFGEIYEQLRFSGQDLAAGTGVNYAVMWLSGAFIPFIMSWALVQKRYFWFGLGAAVQVLLYSTAGLKSILLSVIVIPAIFILLRNQQRIPFGIKIATITAVGFIALNTANLMVGDLSQAHLMLSALVFMRTFGISGLSTAQYHDFFADHPWTRYSHVSGINLFVDYPYEKALGREIGYFYSGNLDLNSNAHLWCMDGLAGFGIAGILLVSILCAVCLWLLDSCAEGHDIRFSATAVSFAALNLSNASLFTSLVSGGLIFSLALLYFLPRSNRDENALPQVQSNEPEDVTAKLSAEPGALAPVFTRPLLGPRVLRRQPRPS